MERTRVVFRTWKRGEATVVALFPDTMNTIGTTRKLQQEWPEAYNLYLESINMEPEEKENGCDQVESLRAELSQLKPTGND